MQKPSINKIVPDIKGLSIYLRSTKKFGKTTLFRDVILAKYGDPSRGLLVGCGNEIGYKMLDNLNKIQVTSYKDLIELKDWLIKEKGKEHNIEIVAFDTGDELALLADKETIRQSNLENPTKKCKSIKAAFGGYTAGEKFAANDVIKPFMSELQMAGFGTWVISHTKFKTIKEKGGLDEDGYMQLTSNLGSDYESAFGDIFDVTLTGVIDRDFEEKKVGDKVKKYSTDTLRKLYFRETPLIDAGGRFANGAVPEYMVFDKPNMGAEFVKVVEEGMEKSKTEFASNNRTIKTSPVKPKEKKKEIVEEPIDDIVAILITDNVYNCIDTIVSRCQILSLKNNNTKIKEELYQKYNDLDNIEEFKKNINNFAVLFLVDLENYKEQVIAYQNLYDYKDKLELIFTIFLYFYIEVLNVLLEKTICYMKDYETEIKKVANKNKICDIIRKIEIVNKFIFLNKLNLNRDLFIDNFIISMGDYND